MDYFGSTNLHSEKEAEQAVGNNGYVLYVDGCDGVQLIQ